MSHTNRKETMKPIRKDEQVYLKEYINRKFDRHRSHLESERQIDVDNSVERNLSKFKKTLNLNDMIKTVTKLSSDYIDFVDNYESRKLDKKRRLIEAGEKLQKKLSKWQSIRRWEKTPDFVGRLTGDDNPIDITDIDKFLTSVCEEETVKAYDRSKKGQAIRKLDAQREEAENALYSGGSIQAVRQYINSVFTQAGIADNVAKNLLMLSQK
tara:strand:- start:110 stop:742 length:633 start_codon:yes stop_codon:yes gene_type:complete